MEILLKFLATKAVAGFIGMIALLGAKKPDVCLTQPEVKIIADSIYIKTTLKNSFNEQMEKIILSGTPITIRLKISYSTPTTNLIQELLHELKYDLTTKTFLFTKSYMGEVTSPIHKTKDINEAKKFMSEFNMVSRIPEFVEQDGKVTIVMRATIDPVKISAIGDKEFELMALWDYHTPTAKTVVSRK